MSAHPPPGIRAMAPGEVGECEAILRALPDWFGIEAALLAYLRDIESMDTRVAIRGDRIAGFLTLRRHTPRSAEIQVLGVAPELHGRGTGSALVAHAERLLIAEGCEFLQVKTLGPSRENAAYAATRRFYERCGFVPLEENKLWGDVNPCLILVKHLGCLPGGAGRPATSPPLSG